MKKRRFRRQKSLNTKVKASSRRWYVSIFFGILFLSIFYLLWLPDVGSLKNNNPTSTSIIESRIHSGGLHSGYSIAWTPLSGISYNLQRAVVIAEDSNFYGHNGVDFTELWVAISEAIAELEPPRGASTITQQLAKNLYLSESYNPLRKIKELLVAKRLESRLGKKRILEIYLNIIEWGNGIFGIGAASRHYFGIPPQSLTAEQSAFLAALIPNPRTVYNPTLNPRRVERRKQLILRRMHIG